MEKRDINANIRLTRTEATVVTNLSNYMGRDRSDIFREALLVYARIFSDRLDLLEGYTKEGEHGCSSTKSPYKLTWYRSYQDEVLGGWHSYTLTERQRLIWHCLQAIAAGNRSPRRGCIESNEGVPYTMKQLAARMSINSDRAEEDIRETIDLALKDRMLYEDGDGCLWWTNWEDDQGNPEEVAEAKRKAAAARKQKKVHEAAASDHTRAASRYDYEASMWEQRMKPEEDDSVTDIDDLPEKKRSMGSMVMDEIIGGQDDD